VRDFERKACGIRWPQHIADFSAERWRAGDKARQIIAKLIEMHGDDPACGNFVKSLKKESLVSKMARMGVETPNLFGKAWPDDEFQFVKTSWMNGLSAAVIAQQVSMRLDENPHWRKVSRNSVIGKMSRHGIVAPGAKAVTKDGRKVLRKARPKGMADRPRAHRPPSLSMVKRAEMIAKPLGPLVSFDALTQHQCRYSFGHPNEEGFGFCCEPAEAGSPWCKTHKVVCTSGFYGPKTAEDRRARAACAAKPRFSALMYRALDAGQVP